MSSEIVIVLVNTNGYEDTKECVLSIKEYEPKNPYVIIVDNNSDNSYLLDKIKGDYPRLHIIKNTKNVGFGRANNIGINWAFKNLKFEYLLLLNNDTIITEKAISKLIPPFKRDSSIGVTTSKIMYNDNRSIVWYGGGKINYKRGWPKIIDFKQKASNEGANKSKYISFISGCVMMFNKKALKDINGFDEDFFIYCEDTELCMRLTSKQYKLWYESKSVIYHKVQGSRGNNDTTGMNAKNPNLPFLFYHMKSNQWIAMKKRLNRTQFYTFNIFYWSEMFYKSFKIFIKGRTDMPKIFLKTVKRIFSYL